jgi:heme A synthase
VTAGRRYLLGLAIAGLAGLIVASLFGPEHRRGVTYGVLIGLLIQAPLGWWTIRSIGSPRFQVAWVAGMLIRLIMLAAVALVLAPTYGWNTAATLVSLVGTLLLLLMIEAWTAAGLQSETKSR